MKKTFRILKTILPVCLFLFLISCDKKEETVIKTNMLTNITSPVTLQTGLIYVVENPITIEATLNIQPGVIIKFAKDARFDVMNNGSIKAQGTKEKPIVFTSLKDDLFGGDNNGDGTSSLPSINDWGCIWTVPRTSPALRSTPSSPNTSCRSVLPSSAKTSTCGLK